MSEMTWFNNCFRFVSFDRKRCPSKSGICSCKFFLLLLLISFCFHVFLILCLNKDSLNIAQKVIFNEVDPDFFYIYQSNMSGQYSDVKDIVYF